MHKFMVSINDIPPDGKEFKIDDQKVWEDPIREFGMDFIITSPLHMTLFVQPTDDGILLRGSLAGDVSTPCNRCAETAHINIASTFDDYEPLPPENNSGRDDEPSGLIVYENHSPMLNLADVAWEQFMLAIPTNPLCKDDCKGICPECGANLNIAQCSCKRDTVDPRMAALAGVKINRK